MEDKIIIRVTVTFCRIMVTVHDYEFDCGWGLTKLKEVCAVLSAILV